MDYVKGCDFYSLSKYSLKKIGSGKISIIEGLEDVLSYESLSRMFDEAKVDFTDAGGKQIKGMPSAVVFFFTKKIEGKKYIIGLTRLKRTAGEPSGKTGIAKVFGESEDLVSEDFRVFADGFEKEEDYFDHCVIDHLRNEVGAGQIGTAEYHDKVINRVKSKKVLGMTLSYTALFIAMIIIWGLVFDNFALGFCFALCMVGSFTMVTSKSKTETADASGSGDEVTAED